MSQKGVSGTKRVGVENKLPSLPPSTHSKLSRLPSLPPKPPPHDYESTHHLAYLEVSNESLEKSDTLPPPPPPSKSFYNNASTTSSPTFLESFMAKHPRISRHRRRFAAMIFTIVTLVLLLIILLAVLLSRKVDDNSVDNGINNGGGGTGGGGGDWGDGPSATEEELNNHNRGISKPPINHSNELGWTREGSGNATFYDPTVKNSLGEFQQGACEFEYINSVYDMVVALNKPDFGNFPRTSKSPGCGQCLQVYGPNGTVQVQIVDMCPGCKSGSLDLTPGAFAKIAHHDKGRVPITWTRCP
ncbi:hypothetical protein BGZ76_011104 [Entomortierella beljakovae]|nr:hypothetical protein BGZ76_011104 [Entomortierella beljakovae]